MTTAKQVTVNALVDRIKNGQTTIQGAIALLQSKNLKATAAQMKRLDKAQEEFNDGKNDGEGATDDNS